MCYSSFCFIFIRFILGRTRTWGWPDRWLELEDVSCVASQMKPWNRQDWWRVFWWISQFVNASERNMDGRCWLLQFINASLEGFSSISSNVLEPFQTQKDEQHSLRFQWRRTTPRAPEAHKNQLHYDSVPRANKDCYFGLFITCIKLILAFYYQQKGIQFSQSVTISSTKKKWLCISASKKRNQVNTSRFPGISWRVNSGTWTRRKRIV